MFEQFQIIGDISDIIYLIVDCFLKDKLAVPTFNSKVRRMLIGFSLPVFLQQNACH